MMLCVRAAGEGDWPLPVQEVKLVMPYFCSSGHNNYARYGFHSLRSIEASPANRRLGAKGSYLTLVRVADRIL